MDDIVKKVYFDYIVCLIDISWDVKNGIVYKFIWTWEIIINN